MDYSVLVFLLFWGLNVIDASVDAHLRSFDVSRVLGLLFKAGYSDLARTNGVSLVLSFK
jgi:peroxiredoxin family protein